MVKPAVMSSVFQNLPMVTLPLRTHARQRFVLLPGRHAATAVVHALRWHALVISTPTPTHNAKIHGMSLLRNVAPGVQEATTAVQRRMPGSADVVQFSKSTALHCCTATTAVSRAHRERLALLLIPGQLLYTCNDTSPSAELSALLKRSGVHTCAVLVLRSRRGEAVKVEQIFHTG